MKIGSILENQNLKKNSYNPRNYKIYFNRFEISLTQNYGSHLGIDDKEYLNLGVKILKMILR